MESKHKAQWYHDMLEDFIIPISTAGRLTGHHVYQERTHLILIVVLTNSNTAFQRCRDDQPQFPNSMASLFTRSYRSATFSCGIFLRMIFTVKRQRQRQ